MEKVAGYFAHPWFLGCVWDSLCRAMFSKLSHNFRLVLHYFPPFIGCVKQEIYYAQTYLDSCADAMRYIRGRC